MSRHETGRPDHNLAPASLDAFWMPFSSNRAFKEAPNFIVGADGMYYEDNQGRQLLDATAGLWCVNAGHKREQINRAIAEQLEQVDFAHSFNAGHPLVFRFAERLTELFPEPLNHVFFTNSGSESVDTALKLALAYHKLRGEGARQRFIGRELGYHGMGFGGLAVAGIGRNRRQFGTLLPGVDHLRHTHRLEKMAFSRGLPEWGAELADDLERLVELHGAENIAACVVEPVAGAGGVLLPPVGYLQRLRDSCTRHGILLIFDEVITAFGRIGDSCAAHRWSVTPDLITVAKGITNATVPMGGVLVAGEIYDAFMQSSAPGVELFHGYTCSGHPLACAAGLAALDIYAADNLFERSRLLQEPWLDRALSLRGTKNVVDVRCFPLIGAVQFAPRPEAPGARAAEVARYCYEHGVWVRNIGESVAVSPPLIINEAQISQIFETIGAAAEAVG